MGSSGTVTVSTAGSSDTRSAAALTVEVDATAHAGAGAGGADAGGADAGGADAGEGASVGDTGAGMGVASVLVRETFSPAAMPDFTTSASSTAYGVIGVSLRLARLCARCRRRDEMALASELVVGDPRMDKPSSRRGGDLAHFAVWTESIIGLGMDVL
jgi:hypothetical protein